MMLRCFILFLLIFSTGCEKFTGYNYESESVGQQARIYGTVVNAFNPSEPVVNARIELSYLTIYTDSLGKYDIIYILGVDDNRNKPLDIHVTAPLYHDLVTDFIIKIPEQKIDIMLEYGAPKIEKIWIGAPEEVYHQVIITDNQGFENIESVVTTFYYANMTDPLIKTRTVKMMFMGAVPGTGVSFYYQAVEIPTYGEGWSYSSRWIKFIVRDMDGFSDAINKKYSDIMSPGQLFNVGHEQ